MRKKYNILSCCLRGRRKKCAIRSGVRPLSECTGCSKVTVSKVSGDRSICGRMASMGVLPGVVLELLCPACGKRQRRCMIKVNGGTLSLDELTAQNIFVQPA